MPTADGWIRTHTNYAHHRGALLRVLGEADPRGPRAAGAPASWSRLSRAGRLCGRGSHRAGMAARGGEAARSRARRAARSALAALRRRACACSTSPASSPARLHGLLAASARTSCASTRPGSPSFRSWPRTAGPKRLVERDLRADQLSPQELVGRGRPGGRLPAGLACAARPRRRRSCRPAPAPDVAQLAACGWRGPWAGRRGFDSLVQAATGIADARRGEAGAPGPLPAQALDHATGYRLAAAAIAGWRAAPSARARSTPSSRSPTPRPTSRELWGQSPQSRWPQGERDRRWRSCPTGTAWSRRPGSLDGRPLSFI